MKTIAAVQPMVPKNGYIGGLVTTADGEIRRWKAVSSRSRKTDRVNGAIVMRVSNNRQMSGELSSRSRKLRDAFQEAEVGGLPIVRHDVG